MEVTNNTPCIFYLFWEEAFILFYIMSNFPEVKSKEIAGEQQRQQQQQQHRDIMQLVMCGFSLCAQIVRVTLPPATG